MASDCFRWKSCQRRHLGPSELVGGARPPIGRISLLVSRAPGALSPFPPLQRRPARSRASVAAALLCLVKPFPIFQRFQVGNQPLGREQRRGGRKHCVGPLTLALCSLNSRILFSASLGCFCTLSNPEKELEMFNLIAK